MISLIQNAKIENACDMTEVCEEFEGLSMETLAEYLAGLETEKTRCRFNDRLTRESQELAAANENRDLRAVG